MMNPDEYFRGVFEEEQRIALGLNPKPSKPAYSKERLPSGCVLYRLEKPKREREHQSWR